jgi:UDP-3-O-[3-hydroxymyristoyl] glucosamine N-acyltransferase
MTDPVFFVPSRSFTAAEVAALTGAELLDPATGDTPILGLATTGEGGAGKLVFVDSKREAQKLDAITAAAILCPPDLADLAPAGMAVLAVAKPRNAFAQVARLLFPDSIGPRALTGETGISPAAHVDPEARLEAGAVVEAGAVIAAGAAIGRGTVIGPNAVVGPGCRIGRELGARAIATGGHDAGKRA